MKAETGLDSWQKYLIGKMIDAYERTGTYRGEAKCNQNIRIPVTDIFPAYEQDSVNLQELQAFEASMRKLEQLTPIRIQYKDKRIKDEFCAFRIAAAAVEPALYELAGRKPRRELHAGQVDLYERYQRKDSVLDAYVRDQEALLHADKNAWFEPDVAENVMQTVDAIVNNRGNILCRELSISLFGDTKYIEKHGVLSKALRVLKQYGSFDFAETDFNSKKEYEEAILAEYEVYENPAYINFNGDGELVFRNGARLELKAGTPIAVRSDCLSDIVTIRVQADAILTIENLTSYNRLQTDAFQLYLAGYHNHARQKFLMQIHSQNPDVRRWLHFGDLDPDGFCILENLRNKTGIDFKAFRMDLTYLEKYHAFTKKLNANDRKKAENLIQAGKYREILLYMLDHDEKLEQEIISWKEAL